MSTPNGKIFLLSLLLSNNRGKLAYLIGIRQEQLFFSKYLLDYNRNFLCCLQIFCYVFLCCYCYFFFWHYSHDSCFFFVRKICL